MLSTLLLGAVVFGAVLIFLAGASGVVSLMDAWLSAGDFGELLVLICCILDVGRASLFRTYFSADTPAV